MIKIRRAGRQKKKRIRQAGKREIALASRHI
jgi:hypothetical protein